MKDLKDILKESLDDKKRCEELLSKLTDNDTVKNLTDTFGKSARDKKIFKAFLEYVTDKLDEWRYSVEDFVEFLQDEAFGDFLECYQTYGLRAGDDDYFDNMDFDGLVEELVSMCE